jgi:phosphate acetyltransferase
VDKVRAATEIVKKRPDLKLKDLYNDATAVDMEVGQVKCQIQSVGQASVLIFSRFKYRKQHVQQEKENWSIGYGPMLQGLNKPVNDLSRGCTVDDIKYSSHYSNTRRVVKK